MAKIRMDEIFMISQTALRNLGSLSSDLLEVYVEAEMDLNGVKGNQSIKKLLS